MAQVVVYESESDWSAVYIDGRLDRVGDHYLADERIREIYGVATVQSEDFLMGQLSRDGVAKTLEELNAYASDRAAKKEQADQLRAQAAELEKQAAELEAP